MKTAKAPAKSGLRLEDLGDVVTADQLSKFLHVGRNQAYALINTKAIGSVRVGPRSIRIPKTSLVTFLEGRSTQ